jgi:hypothetical protein
MDQSLVDELKARLPGPKDRLALERVAAGSGVPIHTLLKIVNGETADPRVSTYQALFNYLEKQAA